MNLDELKKRREDNILKHKQKKKYPAAAIKKRNEHEYIFDADPVTTNY